MTPRPRSRPKPSPSLKNRGVTYWQAEGDATGPCSKRIYLGTMSGRLHALDADTGALCADFAMAAFWT